MLSYETLSKYRKTLREIIFYSLIDFSGAAWCGWWRLKVPTNKNKWQLVVVRATINIYYSNELIKKNIYIYYIAYRKKYLTKEWQKFWKMAATFFLRFSFILWFNPKRWRIARKLMSDRKRTWIGSSLSSKRYPPDVFRLLLNSMMIVEVLLLFVFLWIPLKTQKPTGKMKKKI